MVDDLQMKYALWSGKEFPKTLVNRELLKKRDDRGKFMPPR